MYRYFLALILLNAQLAWGQAGLREELQQYTRSQIVPILSDQRAQLESELTKSEKKRIRRLRWEFRQIISESNEEVQLLNDPSEEVLFYFGNNQELIQSLLEDAWEIAGAHETTIDQLLKPIRKQRRQWQKDWKDIFDKYGSSSERSEADIVAFDGRFKRIFIPAFFILWSPEGLIFDHTAKAEHYSLTASLRPNPVTGNELTISLHIEDPGVYEASFIGMGGVINLTRSLEYAFEGDYEEVIEVGSLVPGEYFLRISNTKATVLMKFQRNEF